MKTCATALALLALAGALAPGVVGMRVAFAASSDAECEEIGWPVNKDRDEFAASDLPQRPSGARLKRIDRAVELALKRPDHVQLFLRPEVALDKQRFSGAVTFLGVPHPGLYQVTLSEPAEIEVFENGVRLKPEASAQARNCPGVAQSTRYQLAPGDLVLVEIINAPQPTIKVAFDQAEAKTAK